jgi:hypothetical protein
MNSEFHIFFCEGKSAVTMQQAGLNGTWAFPSLSDATRHLRNRLGGQGGLVVIHNGNEEPANRIPVNGQTIVGPAA